MFSCNACRKIQAPFIFHILTPCQPYAFQTFIDFHVNNAISQEMDFHASLPMTETKGILHEIKNELRQTLISGNQRFSSFESFRKKLFRFSKLGIGHARLQVNSAAIIQASDCLPEPMPVNISLVRQ